MRRHGSIATGAIASLLLIGCGASSSGASPDANATISIVSNAPSPASFAAPTTSDPTSTIPAPTPTAEPLATVDEVDCDGDVTGGDLDYGPEATGGDPDLVAATRVLRGVRWSDVLAVEGDRSGVVRDGRTVFVGSWFRSKSGGWLIHQYDACRDADVGLGRPRGLVRDAMAEVVVDGGVRVRSLPTVDAMSIKYEPLLSRGESLFVVDGPVTADGYDWYLVQALQGIDRGPFGWVAAASREGETWIDDLEEVRLSPHPGGRAGSRHALRGTASALLRRVRALD